MGRGRQPFRRRPSPSRRCTGRTGRDTAQLVAGCDGVADAAVDAGDARRGGVVREALANGFGPPGARTSWPGSGTGGFLRGERRLGGRRPVSEKRGGLRAAQQQARTSRITSPREKPAQAPSHGSPELRNTFFENPAPAVRPTGKRLAETAPPRMGVSHCRFKFEVRWKSPVRF